MRATFRCDLSSNRFEFCCLFDAYDSESHVSSWRSSNTGMYLTTLNSTHHRSITLSRLALNSTATIIQKSVEYVVLIQEKSKGKRMKNVITGYHETGIVQNMGAWSVKNT